MVLCWKTSLVCCLVCSRSSRGAAHQPMAVTLMMKRKHKPPEKPTVWFYELLLFKEVKNSCAIFSVPNQREMFQTNILFLKRMRVEHVRGQFNLFTCGTIPCILKSSVWFSTFESQAIMINC